MSSFYKLQFYLLNNTFTNRSRIVSKTRYNLKFLITIFVLLVGISHYVAANTHMDVCPLTDEIKIPEKKKKMKKQKSIQQSLSLLQEHLPQYNKDVLETMNTDKYPHRMFNFVNPSNMFVSERLFSIFSFRINLMQNIFGWLGTPYRYGGKGMNGVDCSGFTSAVINKTIGKKVLIGSSRNQVKQVRKIFSQDSLQFGDLVFFARTKISKKISHVAIYLGNNVFAHSSSSRGVIVSVLDNHYYHRYRFGGRLSHQWNYACSH
jgi:hypothetical protein